MTWAPDYVTPAVLKSYLSADNADDVFIALWVTTASRNVDDFCGRQFGKVAAPDVRQYATVYDRQARRYVAEIDDLMDITGLAVADDDGNAVTDYELQPVNNLVKGRPYERISTSVAGPLHITGLPGWTAVPSSVSTGLLLQAARLDARRGSPFGIAGSPAEGSEVRLLAALDPDFKVALKPFVRRWWAG